MGRPLTGDWDAGAVMDAAALIASYSGKARKHFEASDAKIRVSVRKGGIVETVEVVPSRETALPWTEPQPAIVAEWKKERAGNNA